MHKLVMAILATMMLGSGAAYASAKAPSDTAKVATVLRAKGYAVKATQVQIRGMGLRLPGKPNSGKTKVWFVNTKQTVLSGRITFNTRGTMKITINDTTKHAL